MISLMLFKMTNAERQRLHRERKAAKLAQLVIWAKPEHHAAILKAVEKITGEEKKR